MAEAVEAHGDPLRSACLEICLEVELRGPQELLRIPRVALGPPGDALVVLGAARLGKTRLIDNLEV